MSRIFTKIEDVLYCSVEGLLHSGVSEGTIKWGLANNIQTWQSIKDPSDQRRRLIRFDTLREKYKALMLAKWGTPEDYLNQQEQERQAHFFEEMEPQLEVRSKHYHFYQKFYPKNKAYQYAKVCAWLDLLIHVKGAQAKQWGFGGKRDFLDKAAAYFSTQDWPIKLGNVRVLQRRCTDWKRDRAEGEEAALKGVLNGRVGNQNARKIHQEQAQYLIAVMGRPSKPSTSTVLRLYNNRAKEMGWKQLEIRQVEKFLYDPDQVAKWYLSRHGKKAAYNALEMSTKRHKATAPNVLWIMDGTPVDLYYKNRERKYNASKQDWEWTETKWNRLNLFAIMDAHSWKIIGYYLSERENHVAVVEALRDAVRQTMQLPKQLMYDNGSATKAVQNVLNGLARYRTANKPYKAKPKTIEAVFGHFQQEVLRYNPNWSGQNITAKKQNSRVNPEALQDALYDLPDRAALEQNIAMMIATWNEMATAQREKPNFLYSQKSQGTAIDWMTFTDLFYVVTTRKNGYKYHPDGGITITIAGEEHSFQTWDQQLHYSRLVNQRFQIAYDPDTMEYIYLYTLKGNKLVLDDKEQPIIIPRLEPLPQAIGDYKEGDAERVKRYLKAQEEGERLLQSLKREVDEYAAEQGIQLTPQYVHKAAYNRAEAALKRQQAQDEGASDDWLERFNNPYK